MNEHVSGWLGAYHDGELTAARRAEVETHLEGCAECRAEMGELEKLSALLMEMELFEIREASYSDTEEALTREALTPALSQGEREKRFVEGVMARLPERESARRSRWLRRGWRWAPLGLFGMWAFLQAAALVAGGLVLAAGWIPGASRLVGALVPKIDLTWGLDGVANGLLGLAQAVIPNLGGLPSVVAPVGLFGLAISALVGLLLLGWMAGEVVRMRTVGSR